MSEESGTYNVQGRQAPIDKRSLLLFDDPDYRPPTPADVTIACKMTGMSSAGIGKLLGVDSRNVRRYKSGQIKMMPYAAWRLLLLHLKMVKVPKEL